MELLSFSKIFNNSVIEDHKPPPFMNNDWTISMPLMKQRAIFFQFFVYWPLLM